MVWRISKEITKKQVSDTQKTALYGLIMIVPLGLLAWAIEHIRYKIWKKTFKDFAEACWDTHKQVGFKMKGGKRVPNCVPKNEEGNLTEAVPYIVVDKDNSVLYRGTKDNAFKYQVKKYSTHPNLKIYAGSKLKVGDTYKFRYGQHPIDNPKLQGVGKARTKQDTIRHYMQTKASYNAEQNIPHELYDLSELGPAAMKRRARMRAEWAYYRRSMVMLVRPAYILVE